MPTAATATTATRATATAGPAPSPSASESLDFPADVPKGLSAADDRLGLALGEPVVAVVAAELGETVADVDVDAVARCDVVADADVVGDCELDAV